jgi:hypothetical protein
MRCPYCKYDSILESVTFKESVPNLRYFQAKVKYLKIKKISEEKKYKDHENNSGRIRDLTKDCLNDMEMAIELKFGKRSKKNTFWEPWMHDLADFRNQAIHKATAISIVRGSGDANGCYLHEEKYGKTSSLKIVPYLQATLGKIKAKLRISET